MSVPTSSSQDSAVTPVGAVCDNHPQTTASATCQRCGTFVCSTCLDHGVHVKCPSCRALEGDFKPTPWEQRSQIGLVSGLYRTWMQLVFSPTEFFRKTNPKGSITETILFSCFVSIPGGVIMVVMTGFGLGDSTNRSTAVILDFLGRKPPEWLLASLSLREVIVYAMLKPCIDPIIVFTYAGIVHIGCIVFGARRNGFPATARAIGYSWNALYPISALISFVPFVGLALGVFGLVFETLGVAQLQKTSGWRATASILWCNVAYISLRFFVFYS